LKFLWWPRSPANYSNEPSRQRRQLEPCGITSINQLYIPEASEENWEFLSCNVELLRPRPLIVSWSETFIDWRLWAPRMFCPHPSWNKLRHSPSLGNYDIRRPSPLLIRGNHLLDFSITHHWNNWTTSMQLSIQNLQTTLDWNTSFKPVTSTPLNQPSSVTLNRVMESKFISISRSFPRQKPFTNSKRLSVQFQDMNTRPGLKSSRLVQLDNGKRSSTEIKVILFALIVIHLS